MLHLQLDQILSHALQAVALDAVVHQDLSDSLKASVHLSLLCGLRIDPDGQP
jgi:hypothetical protein